MIIQNCWFLCFHLDFLKIRFSRFSQNYIKFAQNLEMIIWLNVWVGNSYKSTGCS